MISTLEEFKNFVVALLRLLIQKGNDRAAQLEANLVKLSNDLTEANAKIAELQAAIEAKDAEKVQAVLAESAKLVAELDVFSTQLVEEFNPTPATDDVAEAVQELPEIETPVEVEESTDIGQPTETPVEVGEAAVEAVADVVDSLE